MLFNLLAAASLAVSQAPATAVDDTALVKFMRSVGTSTRGVTVKDGAKADKIVYAGQSDRGIVVIGIEVKPIDGGWGDPPVGTVAILRTRPTLTAHADARDTEFALKVGLPIFIIADEGQSGTIREIANQGGKPMVRDIAADGSAGSWREP